MENKKLASERKDVIQKHNKVAKEYNSLLRRHDELANKFNKLVSELQDPSFATFVGAKAIQAYHHPGITGAMNKTLIHVMPVVQEGFLRGRQESQKWLNKTQSSVQTFLEAHGGDAVGKWLPAMSGFIVYSSVIIPLAIACWCVLEFVCKLQLLLLFGHVYLAAAGLCAGGFALASGEDPLIMYAEQDWEVYQFAQVVFALMFVLYAVLSCAAIGSGRGSASFSCSRLLATISFGVAYYVLVWTPAMIDEMPRVKTLFTFEQCPRMIAAPYLAVSATFAVLFGFEKFSDSTPAGPEETKAEEGKAE